MECKDWDERERRLENNDQSSVYESSSDKKNRDQENIIDYLEYLEKRIMMLQEYVVRSVEQSPEKKKTPKIQKVAVGGLLSILGIGTIIHLPIPESLIISAIPFYLSILSFYSSLKR